MKCGVLHIDKRSQNFVLNSYNADDRRFILSPAFFRQLHEPLGLHLLIIQNSKIISVSLYYTGQKITYKDYLFIVQFWRS